MNNNPKEQRHHLHLGGKLKSRRVSTCLRGGGSQLFLPFIASRGKYQKVNLPMGKGKAIWALTYENDRQHATM
jgi:hypothetical protein